MSEDIRTTYTRALHALALAIVELKKIPASRRLALAITAIEGAAYAVLGARESVARDLFDDLIENALAHFRLADASEPAARVLVTPPPGREQAVQEVIADVMRQYQEEGMKDRHAIAEAAYAGYDAGAGYLPETAKAAAAEAAIAPVPSAYVELGDGNTLTGPTPRAESNPLSPEQEGNFLSRMARGEGG